MRSPQPATVVDAMRRVPRRAVATVQRVGRPYPPLDDELDRFGRRLARRLDTETRRLDVTSNALLNRGVWTWRIDEPLAAGAVADTLTNRLAGELEHEVADETDGSPGRADAVVLDVERRALGDDPLRSLRRALESRGHRVAGIGFAPVEPLRADRVVALIAGDWYVEPLTAPPDFRVLAIMTAYNEGDIVRPTIERLIAGGVDVHLIDNWSTDSTADMVSDLLGHGLVAVERFPVDGPPERFELERLLRRVAEIADESTADWCVHHDVDQRRDSPWDGVSYRSGLFTVDRSGFNAVDHTLFEFRPVDDGYVDGDELSDHFRHFELVPSARSAVHVQAWKNDGPVDLASTGGHRADFDGRRIYPINFTLRHHPVRSQSHGERKIFQDRKPRYDPSELEQGWHYHYARLRSHHDFVYDAGDLHEWDDDRFHGDYFLPRAGQVCIPDREPGAIGATKAAVIRTAARTNTLGPLVRASGALTRAFRLDR